MKELCTSHMVVMEVRPSNGRIYKHRIFTHNGPLQVGDILDLEMREAKTLGVKITEVLTVNIVPLQ